MSAVKTDALAYFAQYRCHGPWRAVAAFMLETEAREYMARVNPPVIAPGQYRLIDETGREVACYVTR